MSAEKRVRVALVGAGEVNFGSFADDDLNTNRVAWGHAPRLEKLDFVDIICVYNHRLSRAEENIAQAKKRAPERWAQTVAVDKLERLRELNIDAAIVGLPPAVHGVADSGKDVELQLLAHGINLFLEKPITAFAPERVEPFRDQLVKVAEENKLVVSVGYMLRYGAAVQRVRELMTSFGTDLRSLHATYSAAYEHIYKAAWWDNASPMSSGGVIVEQATHFCDLARYLGGEVDLTTVQGIALSACNAKLGSLSRFPKGIDESAIPPEGRVPRVSHAFWRYESGAIGMLTHHCLLHGYDYETSVELVGDGWFIRLSDPYNKPSVSYRAPGGDKVVVEKMPADDDMFLTEDRVFLQAVAGGDRSAIRSSYADAFKSHTLAWAIKRATEAHSA